jgi:hypothetical protein
MVKYSDANADERIVNHELFDYFESFGVLVLMFKSVTERVQPMTRLNEFRTDALSKLAHLLCLIIFQMAASTFLDVTD